MSPAYNRNAKLMCREVQELKKGTLESVREEGIRPNPQTICVQGTASMLRLRFRKYQGPGELLVPAIEAWLAYDQAQLAERKRTATAVAELTNGFKRL